MNNQNYQILLGIILLVVYFTCFKKSEGFFLSARPMVGKEYCFSRKRSLYGGTRDVILAFGRGLIRGSPRVVKNCKDGKVRKVTAQVMTLKTYKNSRSGPFRIRRRRWRTFKPSSGWTTKPLPADTKKANRALLNYAEKGYQSMVIYNFGKVNSKVRLNKKNIPLSGWSSNRNNGPTKGSFIRRGLSDPTARMRSKLRNCHTKLRQCRAGSRPSAAAPAAAAPRVAPPAASGDAW